MASRPKRPRDPNQLAKLIVALTQSTRAERPSTKGKPLANGDESAPEIAKQLRQYNGTEIDSAKLMPIIGAKTSSGVGSKLYHLRKRIPLDEHVALTKKRDEKGVVTWRVKML